MVVPCRKKTDVLVDQGCAFRKQGDLELGHGGYPVQVRSERNFRYHIEIRYVRNRTEL